MTKDENFAQGLIKVKENDHHGAIELFTIVLEKEPKNADALSQRAVAYLNIEEYELSMNDMNLAIEYDPEYSYRYQTRAYLKARVSDHLGAVKDYEKAIELDPKDSIAHNNLALAQEQLGWASKAKSNFDKSDTMAGIRTADERAKARKVKAAEEKEQMVAQTQEEQTKGEIAKSVFTKKSVFKEFIQFIRNGFKLKQNDES